MNNSVIKLVVFSFFITSFCACNNDDYFEDNIIVVEEFHFKEIQGIKLEIDAVVRIERGPVQKIILEGPKNVIDNIHENIHNGIWHIDLSRHSLLANKYLNISIIVPHLIEVEVRSSGKVIMEDYFDEMYSMDLKLSGSGSIKFLGQVNYLSSINSGTGEIILTGEAYANEISNSGTGTIEGWNCPTNDILFNSSGSGDSHVYAIKSLIGNISGSGDVYYIGNPDIDVIATGSGELINSN